MRIGGHDKGFTMVELMVVVLIIGVLVAIAIPVYASTREKAAQRTCFSNQRVVEGAAQAYSSDNDADIGGLAGVVTAGHPLVDEYIFRQPPSCPSAPAPPDQDTVDAAHGAYTLNAQGDVAPCTFGDPVHGLFR